MAGDYLSLISAIPSLMQAFGGSSNPYGDQQKKLADQQAETAAALGNPSNPLYQQLYGQYRDQNRQSLAQSIAEAQAQNRMNVALGRTPLIGAERGPETLFRILMQGYQQGDNQANAQTMDALKARLSGAGYAQKSYLDATPGAAKANAQQLAGFQGIQDLLMPKQGTTQPQMSSMMPTATTGQAPTSNLEDLLKKLQGGQQQAPQGYTF